MLLCGASAQAEDSLFVVRKGGNWAIKYTVKPGETAHMLALRFYISDGVLTYANDDETMKKFSMGSVITIPITAENYSVSKQTFGDQRELYYRVGQKDDIGLVSTYAGVTKAQIRTWNELKGNTLHPDEILFVGWVKYMNKDSSNPVSEQAYPIYRSRSKIDMDKMPVPGGLDTIYNRQTNFGTDIITEKGTAVFFEQPGRNRVYYAFHNATPKGAIIKVFNPGNGKTIYVKVLGPLPDTKLYANSIIGICATAKEALGVTDNKSWCELSYSPN